MVLNLSWQGFVYFEILILMFVCVYVCAPCITHVVGT